MILLLCRYFVVGPAAQATHVAVWISKHLPSSVQLRDVTSQYTVLAVMGPHSRKLLEQVTSHPLDNDNFPFGTSQVINVVYLVFVTEFWKTNHFVVHETIFKDEHGTALSRECFSSISWVLLIILCIYNVLNPPLNKFRI